MTEPSFEPLGQQISSIKIISSPDDSDTIFAIGSNHECDNKLALYKYSKNTEIDPLLLLDRRKHLGIVTDIQYNRSHNRILTCNDVGSLTIYEIDNQGMMKADVKWDGITKNKTALTGAIFYDDRIVCVSEIGDILSLRLEENINNHSDVFRMKERFWGGCLTCVEKIGESEKFCTGSSLNGYCLNLWDGRIKKDKAVVWKGLGEGVWSIAVHPGMLERRIIGGSNSINGNIAVWDARSGEKPIYTHELGKGHTAYTIKFKPDSPNEVWAGISNAGLARLNECVLGNLQYTSSMVLGGPRSSVNALDLSNNILIAGSDKEVLCLLNL